MKLTCLFETVDMDNESFLVPVGKGAENIQGVIKLNGAAKEILSLIENDSTEKSIVDALAKKYGNEQEELAAFVHDTVETLCKTGLIEE